MIPLVKPTLPKLKSLQKKLKDIFETGMLTNAKYVKEFEDDCANFLDVENVIAFSSGASAIIMMLKCLKLEGEIIMPSFTFTASAHPLLWCGLKPIFADVDSQTFNLDPASVEKKITKNTSAIMPTHVFGNPCNIDGIQALSKKYNLKVVYDGAHAFGAEYKGKSVAVFGNAVIFSLTPTKTLTAGEGGLVSTNDKNLAKILRFGRNNGDSIDREEEFLGLSARMPEFCAILGIESLKILPKGLKRRQRIVALYKKELSSVSGISFQKIMPDCVSAYKDFTILVDKNEFGMSRDDLLKELLKRDIETRVYFYPALHQKKVYRKLHRNDRLPNTDYVSTHIMNLPLYSHMPESFALKVCSVIKKLHKNAKK